MSSETKTKLVDGNLVTITTTSTPLSEAKATLIAGCHAEPRMLVAVRGGSETIVYATDAEVILRWMRSSIPSGTYDIVKKTLAEETDE